MMLNYLENRVNNSLLQSLLTESPTVNVSLVEGQKVDIDILDPRVFTQDEIREIHTYIEKNVQYSDLNRLFALSEKLIEKSQIFTTIFSLLESAKDYSQEKETRDKLNNILEKCRLLNDKLYYLLVEAQSCNTAFYRQSFHRKIFEILSDSKNRSIIHSLRSIFLVLVEKQIVYNIDKITGINLNVEEGVKIVEEARKVLDIT